MKKPCKSCPFSRTGNQDKPNPGGSSPERYLGQIRGPFYLPCHRSKDYKSETTTVENTIPCAGAAIFRSNCDLPYKLPEGLSVSPDNKNEELVFSNEKEFYDFYYEKDSGDKLSKQFLDNLLWEEVNDVRVRNM